MAKVFGTIRAALGAILLTGCGTLDFGNRPTSVGPLPVKGSLRDGSVIVGVPLRVEKRVTGGYRSRVDLQFEVKLTEPEGVELPLVPNGLVVGPRVRW